MGALPPVGLICPPASTANPTACPTYRVPDLPLCVWTMLPTDAAMTAMVAAVRQHFQTTAPVLAVAGAQAAIQMIPWLPHPTGRKLARVLAPTYNEHAATLRAAGWQVQEVAHMADLAGADLAVVVNPNNPDGRAHSPADLLALLPQLGRLVVDESFGDITPDLSMLPHAGGNGLLILRSFGKFWGLAGARLGFVFGPGLMSRPCAQWRAPGLCQGLR